jgi:paraquat-inducible protein B
LGFKDYAKLVPSEDDMKPTDPISENMNILKLKPVKAFMYQDHEAHIKVHMNAMKDPLIQQLVGQNPQAPMIQQGMMAHLMEHIAFAYRSKIEKALGADLPKPDEEMNPAVEVQLSRLVAQAAPMVLQESQNIVAQQAAAAQQQAMAQDPMLQLQQAELQLRAQELDLKRMKMQADAAAAADKLELEQDKLAAQMELEGLKVGSEIKFKEMKLNADNEREGVRIGADIAKQREDLDIRRRQATKPQSKGGK